MVLSATNYCNMVGLKKATFAATPHKLGLTTLSWIARVIATAIPDTTGQWTVDSGRSTNATRDPVFISVTSLIC